MDSSTFSCLGVGDVLQGLTAVYFGIVPKMAVRFSSFETYKGLVAGPDGKVGRQCSGSDPVYEQLWAIFFS